MPITTPLLTNRRHFRRGTLLLEESVPSTDTLGPTVAPPPSVVTTGETTQTVKFIPAMDAGDGVLTPGGMWTAQLQRRVWGTSTWFSVKPDGTTGTGAFSLSPGNTANFEPLTIGSPAGTNTSTQDQADFNFLVAGGNLGYALGEGDQVHARVITASGNGNLVFSHDPYAAGYEWNEVGEFVRPSSSPTAAVFALQSFAAHLIESSHRLTAGAVRDGVVATGSVPSGRRNLWINVNGDALTGYYYSDAVAQWVEVNSQEIDLGSTFLVGAYACTNGIGGAISPTILSLAWDTNGEKTVNVSALEPNTAYEYSVLFEDIAGNQRRSQISPWVATEAEEGTPEPGTVRWHPGFGRECFPHVATEPGRPNASTSGWAADTVAKFFMVQLYLSAWATETPRVYDWTLIDYYLDGCPEGKQLFFNIWPHVISPEPYYGDTEYFIPTYLEGSEYGGMWPFNYGKTMAFWTPGGMTELIAMVRALIAHCKSNPKFGGLTMMETSWDFGQSDDGEPPSFSEDAMLAQYERMYEELREESDELIFTSRANWGTTSKLQAHAEKLYEFKWGCGTTDATARRVTTMDEILNGSEGGIDYRDLIPILAFVEFEDYYEGDSAATTYAYNRSTYRTNYLAWNEFYLYDDAEACVASIGALPDDLPECFA